MWLFTFHRWGRATTCAQTHLHCLMSNRTYGVHLRSVMSSSNSDLLTLMSSHSSEDRGHLLASGCDRCPQADFAGLSGSQSGDTWSSGQSAVTPEAVQTDGLEAPALSVIGSTGERAVAFTLLPAPSLLASCRLSDSQMSITDGERSKA